jgi:hypothetical protein
MQIAVMQVSCRIWILKKAVILSAAIQATGKVDAPPSERVSEIDLSVKQFKNLKNTHNFKGSHPTMEIVGKEMGGYFGKKFTNTSRTSACKPSLHSDKLEIKINNHADLSRYYAKENQHNSWNTMEKNKYNSQFHKRRCSGNVSTEHRSALSSVSLMQTINLSIPNACVLQRDDNSKMNLHYLPNQTSDRWEQSNQTSDCWEQSLVKLHLVARM